MEKRILFTTAYVKDKLYDYWGANTPDTLFRFTWVRKNSFGLRFLKQNIPEIDILEFPKFEEFKKKLKSGKYDVLGISFYINEVPQAIEMINYARKLGIKEIWGGNYGAMTPEVKKYFDKIFIGYSEEAIAKELGKKIERIVHPPIVIHTLTPFGVPILVSGTIQTTRGCSLNCKFCQTPKFCSKVSPVPIESIDKVLAEYKKLGIREVFIFDENFGLIKKHADQVASLMDKYKLNWYAMTRADILLANFEEWQKKGLIGAFIGIESFSQENLDFVEKKESREKILALLERLNKKSLLIIGYYMICFENETKKSILRDMEKLKKIRFDLCQICVVTPFPETQLKDYLSNKFGIINHNYSDYDTKHLVWKHPNIKPEEVKELLKKCFKIVYTKRNFLNSWIKFYKKYTAIYGFWNGIRYMYMGVFNATKSYYFKKEYKQMFFK